MDSELSGVFASGCSSLRAVLEPLLHGNLFYWGWDWSWASWGWRVDRPRRGCRGPSLRLHLRSALCSPCFLCTLWGSYRMSGCEGLWVSQKHSSVYFMMRKGLYVLLAENLDCAAMGRKTTIHHSAALTCQYFGVFLCNLFSVPIFVIVVFIDLLISCKYIECCCVSLLWYN